jgi:hypothetical protein
MLLKLAAGASLTVSLIAGDIFAVHVLVAFFYCQKLGIVELARPAKEMHAGPG